MLLRARLISGVPVELIGSLTGLTEGRFPVAAPARYADDLAEEQLLKRVRRGENAANLVESSDRRSIDIFTRRNAPVVAVNDGVIKRIGRNRELGRYVVLEDVYGNRYSYAHLGKVPAVYPVPNDRAADAGSTVFGPRAHQDLPPDEPASAGRQQAARSDRNAPKTRRLFAHPYHPYARKAGGLDQQLDAEVRRYGTARDLQELLRAPVRPQSVQGDPAPADEGRARDRRDDHRACRPRAGWQGAAPRLLDPAGRSRRAPDRSEAGPGRLEAARGHRYLPRQRRERAARRADDRADPAAVEVAAREARAGRRAHRDLRLRPRGHSRGPDRPPRAGDARVPVGAGAEPHRQLAEMRPRLLHEVRQRLGAQLRQRRGHLQDQRHSRDRPPGGRWSRRPGGPADRPAAGRVRPAPGDLAARHGRPDAGDGRPRRPHPRRLPARPGHRWRRLLDPQAVPVAAPAGAG